MTGNDRAAGKDATSKGDAVSGEAGRGDPGRDDTVSGDPVPGGAGRRGDGVVGPDVEELDCLGQRCPLPVIALARRLPELPVGTVLRIHADDPAAGNDIAAWCRMRGQEFLGSPAPDAFDVRRRAG